MCGIVAALPAYDADLLAPSITASITIPEVGDDVDGFEPAALSDRLHEVSAAGRAAGRAYAAPSTAATLVADDRSMEEALRQADQLCDRLADLDHLIDVRSRDWGAEDTERVQVALRGARDDAYALRHDRLGGIVAVRAFLPGLEHTLSSSAMVGYLAVAAVLSALDRLEVRGRDSAGVGIRVELDANDLGSVRDACVARIDPLLENGGVRITENAVVFVYKHAAIVGSLGHNGAKLRSAIHSDDLLHAALQRVSARVTVLAHTRWASVGRISEANAHPVDNQSNSPLVLAVLNGDVDNHVALRALHPELDERITTDAKLIPLLLAESSATLATDAMVECLARIEGSTAIGALSSASPAGLLLGVKGSGQGLYVGVSEFGYFAASEVYGLVATCQQYLRLDGCGSVADSGTVVELSRDERGRLREVSRSVREGELQPVVAAEWRRPEITSRDLALGDAQHYLQKELGEASSSFRKTLRGRIRTHDGQSTVDLPPSSLPASVIADLESGAINRVFLMGQGTAAVACAGIAEVVRSLLPMSVRVKSTLATEFSAYELTRDLSDTLIIAVSQSGSTTDTNRAVDLARARGARIVAIVNRRDSDLAAKSDGVVYTADGRDVEMAVASTKAFYSQVAAGCLLGLALGHATGGTSAEAEGRLIRALRALPGQLDDLGHEQDSIAKVARETATRYQNWAIVGSGPNKVAASEGRIKLSELCYRTVSTDTVEDKKHIDLSAESLVLVCAAGAPPGQERDLVKEVDIFSAHRNLPVVITDQTEASWATPYVIGVPVAHPILSWILSTAAVHFYAYYAALSIDEAAAPLRAALHGFEAALSEGPVEASQLTGAQHAAMHMLNHIAGGDLVGVLTPATVSRLSVLAVAMPVVSTSGEVATVFAEYATDEVAFIRATLTQAIGELTRPIDAVKHQAKTVTVGTSRDDSDLFDNELIRALETSGIEARSSLSHPVLRSLRAHAPLVANVSGVARYRLRGEPADQILVVSKAGSAKQLQSRAEVWSTLVGSKELVVRRREIRLLRGALDRRLVLVVPEQEGLAVVGVSVLHIDLVPRASGGLIAAALAASGSRLEEIRAAVTEAGEDYTADTLEAVPLETALLAPAEVVAVELMRSLTYVA